MYKRQVWWRVRVHLIHQALSSQQVGGSGSLHLPLLQMLQPFHCACYVRTAAGLVLLDPATQGRHTPYTAALYVRGMGG